MSKLFLFVVALSLSLAACGRRDPEIQRELTGTWVCDWVGGDLRSRTVVASDGRYQCQITRVTGGGFLSLEGTMLARKGALLDTITNESSTNLTVPRINRGRIIRLNDHELVTRWDNIPHDSVERKVEK